jgi:hypothetical protein
MTEFIFMLTHHDATLPDALDILQEVGDTGLRYVGFKDVGATPRQQQRLTTAAHEAGLEVMLEVVSTSADAEIASLKAAVDAGVDWVLGGTRVDEGVRVLEGTGIRYCPFPGGVVGHPSILTGSVEAIAADAASHSSRPGVHGVDLLAYRHDAADPVELIRAVVTATAGPVVVAGSITGPEQIRAVTDAGAWGFTIGGAVFENLLPGAPGVAAQVRAVLAAAATV